MIREIISKIPNLDYNNKNLVEQKKSINIENERYNQLLQELIPLGRFTELNFLTLLVGTVIFGALIAWLARQEKIKNWLSTD